MKRKEEFTMMKYLGIICGFMVSFFGGVLIAAIGYANGSEDDRRFWDSTFKL